MMKRTMLAALAVAVVGLFGAAPADAQDFPEYRFDLGVFGGGAWYSASLDEEHLGEGTDAVRFKAGWVTGLQGTFWATPRIGIRAHGSYSERPLTGGNAAGQGPDGHMVDDVNLWSLSGDLLFRLLPEGHAMFGRQSTPYLALGIGGKNINAAGDSEISSQGETDEAVFFQASPSLGVFLIEEWKLMGLAALGTDLRLADNFALRLEVGDRIWDSPLRDAQEYLTDPEEDLGKVVHEIYGQIGAHMLMGLRRPEIVAVAPAPPPPPPAPTPPAPVEERITVCVIDPGAPNGIRMVDAIYLPERRDTMVVVDGTRRQLSTTLPTVQLAPNAQWFIAGEPLAVTLTRDATLEYTTWQAGRQISANELAYLGNVRGVPVYASTQDVSAVRADLDRARTASGNDLNRLLETNPNLRTTIEGVQYLYVPLRATGCVFQTMQQVERVIKKNN